MNQTILTVLNNFLLNFGCDRALLIFALGQLIAFIIALVLSICVYDYTLKKRAWFFIVLSSINCFCLALFSIAQTGLVYFSLSLGISFCFLSPIVCVRVRKKEIGEKELQLARVLFEKANAQRVDNFKEKPPLETEQTNIKKEKEKQGFTTDLELDFSHVKNVLDRMEFYPLNQAEKKQVADLGALIYSAERGVVDEKTSEKINDALGALLKIMSKHGV